MRSRFVALTRSPQVTVALAGLLCAVLAFFVFAGVVSGYPTIAVFAVGVGGLTALAMDAGGLRRTLPGVSSPSRRTAAASWIALLALLVYISMAADSALLSASDRSARDARASAVAAARSSQAAASDATTRSTTPVSSALTASTSASAVASSPRLASAAASTAPTPTPTLTSPPTPTPTPTPTPIDLARFIPPLDGYTQFTSGGSCSAGRTSAGCLYFGPARPGATTAGASLSATLLGSAAQAASELPDYMHHVDEAPVDLGAIVATGAWRPSIGTVVDPSYMIGFTYGRLVIVIDVQRSNSTRAVTMDWAKAFGTAYVSAITKVPRP
jgi:hypothetical protein